MILHALSLPFVTLREAGLQIPFPQWSLGTALARFTPRVSTSTRAASTGGGTALSPLAQRNTVTGLLMPRRRAVSACVRLSFASVLRKAGAFMITPPLQ